MKRLAFIDFPGEQKGGFFSSSYQSCLENALEKANEYLSENDLDVINVETLWATRSLEGGVRVWYRPNN